VELIQADVDSLPFLRGQHLSRFVVLDRCEILGHDTEGGFTLLFVEDLEDPTSPTVLENVEHHVQIERPESPLQLQWLRRADGPLP
jgi:hypothetical protein